MSLLQEKFPAEQTSVFRLLRRWFLGVCVPQRSTNEGEVCHGGVDHTSNVDTTL